MPPEIDVTTPSFARVYDYLIGGTDHYAVDRQAAEEVLRTSPDAREVPRANRAWLIRAVRAIANSEIRQFLDIGSGLPTANNVHQVAPQARVVYVDNDPIVLAHGRALLEGTDRTVYAEADIREPDAILRQAREHLDFTQPVALVLAAVLHFIPDDDGPADLAGRYLSMLAPGSCMAISHATSDGASPELLQQLQDVYKGRLILRPSSAIADMFQGLPLIEPGLVDIQLWRPDEEAPVKSLRLLGGVAYL